MELDSDKWIRSGWQRITTVDAHTAGEPLRVITGGYPTLEGNTILKKCEFARTHHDDIRRALMLEPRGHADMYGCIITSATTPDGDFGVLFLHNEGYSTMCGHGIIAITKVAIECGLIEETGPKDGHRTVKIDTPSGRVEATALMEDGEVKRVSYINLPSFVLKHDLNVHVPGLAALIPTGTQRIKCDMAYGGVFYAYVDANSLGIEIVPRNFNRLVDTGMRIKHAVMDQFEIAHPDGDAALNYLYGTIFSQMIPGPMHSRNICIFADGEVDRSPTGTGVSGKCAILHGRDEIELGQTIAIESLIGTKFEVTARSTTTVGEDMLAIIPEVSGRAFITGRNEFFINPDDPLRAGFLLR